MSYIEVEGGSFATVTMDTPNKRKKSHGIGVFLIPNKYIHCESVFVHIKDKNLIKVNFTLINNYITELPKDTVQTLLHGLQKFVLWV